VTDARVAIPWLPPRCVSRPRLLASLDQAADVPLTLVCAGPGAGKTVLLADWVRNVKARVAWITPAPADAEPRRFWRLLESALLECADTGGVSAAGALQEPGLDLVPMLFSQVANPRTPLLVVIDDAHVLTDPDVLEGLDNLVRTRQPGLRLVLASRSDPLLPLHRYRLAGQMLELRAADLAMTSAEIKEVLAVHGVRLAERDFALLAARTEGWAAGVKLSAMRMEGTEHPATFVTQLALDPGSVGEYLVDEVLRRLPESQRQLMVETSFLDEVTGPIADAITGMTGCGETLAELARTNSFVIPLDPAQRRYRYHQLFGEILRYMLQRGGGHAERRLKERAASWFEASGDLSSAAYWAAEAGDGYHLASVLARGGLVHAFVRRQDLPGLALRELMPQGDVPEAVIGRAAAEAVCTDPDAAAGELEQLRAWRGGLELTDPDLVATCDLSELILAQKACDDVAVDTAAGRLLGGYGEEGKGSIAKFPGLRAAVLLAQASTHLWHGRHADVGALLEEALAEARHDDQDGLELEVLAMTACVDSIWSRTLHASQTEKQAEALRVAKSLGLPPILELAAAIRALISGSIAGPARMLRRIVLPDVVGSDPALEPLLALGHASALLALARYKEVRAILHEIARRPTPPLLAAHRDSMLADLEVSQGRPRAALAMLEKYNGTEFSTVTAMAAARAHLALNDPHNARACVRSVLSTPSAQTSRFILVETMLCDARIALATEDAGRTLEILIRAIEVARGEIVLPFLRVKDTFDDLLARHPDVADRWPGSLPGRAQAPPLVPAQWQPHDLADPLTQRELTVLRLLVTNMSIGEIADELCLSVNTVKTHLAAIYRKLLASHRREAVLRARQLELI
jgi:LuxR family maltose regulon positive regulatory protein